jgi:hypothetical protein
LDQSIIALGRRSLYMQRKHERNQTSPTYLHKNLPTLQRWLNFSVRVSMASPPKTSTNIGLVNGSLFPCCFQIMFRVAQHVWLKGQWKKRCSIVSSSGVWNILGSYIQSLKCIVSFWEYFLCWVYPLKWASKRTSSLGYISFSWAKR